MKKTYPYYPIFIDVEERSVLIVGGGGVSARKAETLLQYGAAVTIVSPEIADDVARLAPRVTIIRKRYDEADLDGRTLVIASTDDPCVNARIARDCRRRRIPVNVADRPHLCDFILPAVIEQGSVQVAVSTGGKSPALARRLKHDLQRVAGPEYAQLNDLLGGLRAAAKQALPTDDDRKRFFDGILAAGVLELLRAGERDRALTLLAQLCDEAGVPHGLLARRGTAE
ncbi:MAG: precorrin-2 dehydrogenase / Sirohydrochlorin ferrochelatase [Acidobacteria bacterium]|nr:precorrin-2 dehydrogenase / Sirohydrochlorin ferrochelatase [Acidobacteriota bacterium]